jgi:inhibitor of cysteine peptidase
VAVGDEIELTLEETATSGYRWSIEEFEPVVLQPVADTAMPAAPGRLGGPGTRRFGFHVVGAGTSPIRLGLARSWDPTSRSTGFEVTIVAQ